MKRIPFLVAKRGSKAVSYPSSTSSEEIARRLTEVIQRAYTQPFSLQSDFSRRNAFYVAAAASLGYITTRTSPRSFSYGHLWRTTKAGLHYLEKD